MIELINRMLETMPTETVQTVYIFTLGCTR